MRAMVIDSWLDVGDCAANLLRAAGAKVNVFADGCEAARKLRQPTSRRFDLVLCELDLTGGSYWRTSACTCRRFPWCSCAPVRRETLPRVPAPPGRREFCSNLSGCK